MKKEDIKVLTPLKGLIHLVFKNQYDLTSTFMRFQEFYESPIKDINGHYFTYQHGMDRYAEVIGKGKMTYFEDWNGFNIPGDVFDKAYNTFYPDLTEKEKILVNLVSGYENFLKGIRKPFEKYYVIGTHAKHDCLKHETQHALYYLNDEYRHKMYALIEGMDFKVYDAMAKKLEKQGYNQSQFADEICSYLTDATRWKTGCLFQKFTKNPTTKAIGKSMIALYNEYHEKMKKV